MTYAQRGRQADKLTLDHVAQVSVDRSGSVALIHAVTGEATVLASTL